MREALEIHQEDWETVLRVENLEKKIEKIHPLNTCMHVWAKWSYGPKVIGPEDQWALSQNPRVNTTGIQS